MSRGFGGGGFPDLGVTLKKARARREGKGQDPETSAAPERPLEDPGDPELDQNLNAALS